jgi:crossover junction endodeoxyribonuclease RuvC
MARTVTAAELQAALRRRHQQASVPLGGSSKNQRVLAIDPALRHTGWAVLEGNAQRTQALAWGTIANPAKLSTAACLLEIHRQLGAVIAEHQPEVCAIESTIFVQSMRTAITLGMSSGACLIAAAAAGLPVFQYAPREIKQAAVGRGGAQKSQVAFMMRSLLGLRETPAADAADALAVGLTHLQANQAEQSTGRDRRKL